MPQHRETNVGERSQPIDFVSAALAQVGLNHGFKVVIRDPLRLIEFAILMFRQIRLALIAIQARHDGIMKGKMLEGVQRIMVDENFDGPLSR